MAATTLCAICQKKKARRECPGVRGWICAPCCGAEREVTVDCPLDCVYLREARRHEPEQTPTLEDMPFPGIEVSDSFLAEHEHFIGQIAFQLLRHSLANPKTTDNDLRAAMEKLVRTYETLSSGIYYESLPDESSQIAVFRDLKKFFDEYQEKERQKGSLTPLKEGDVIRALAFLSRLAALHSNQRARGRAFIDFLRQSYPESAAPKEESRLIVPGR
jgi:hypothetical protein